MTEWFEEWFGEEYLQLYPHRDEADAERAVRLVLESTGFAPGWRVLDVACGAGRHARALRRAGARCFGVDLSATLLRIARTVTDAHLVRADMRRLPIRPGSMDLTVNLFTSFGYFDRESDHAGALGEMVATLRPGGWFVIDFLNPPAVRATLVPWERLRLNGRDVEVRRELSEDSRHVTKTITTADGRRFRERVRLFEADEISRMLAAVGVSVQRSYGDYAGTPLGATSPRTILVGCRE
ncbi:MAG TPA: class I SAM-dependent methyltransferase [Gemmatimonadales bacterium]|nr:class I SAM-dependent methyltransferase [Gemmatimonadales bacterium]